MSAPLDTNAIRAATASDWHAERLTTQNGVNLKFRVMRNTCADFHVHADWPEAFFVLSGTVVIDTEHGSVELAPGQFHEVPRGVSHRSRVVGEATVLVVDQAPA